MQRKKIFNILSIAFVLLLCRSAALPALEITDVNEYLYPEASEGISMDFKNAPLNDVLKIFSQQSGLNFIASTSVANKLVNLYLDKVPVEEALERILSANSLTYEIKAGSNIFVVKQLDQPEKLLISRVYPFRHATVPSSKLNKTFEDEEGEAQAGEEESKEGILAAIKAILTKDGSVIEDIRTNSIIVSDIPNQFPLIEQTIARLDVRIPQVLIEVEMLDISKNTADLMGVKFGNTPVTFAGAERDTVYPFNRNKILNDSLKTFNRGFTFEDPEYRVGTLSFAGLQMTLNFLRTHSDTKNLARPRILTLNNETAEIEIKTDEAIGLASTATATEGIGSSVEKAERVETGVFLKVTPQANVQSREITMAIEPKVIQARTGQTFGSSTFKDPEERGTKSILRIKDGDTVIIGGLLRTTVEETKTRVPLLGKIPVLGAAFRHKDKTESERELIIFITPHIIEEAFASNVSKGSNNLVREQDIPLKRLKEIDKELSLIEKKMF